jgi:hypothetical protein
MVVYGGFYYGACGHPFTIEYWANTMAGFALDGTTWSTMWPNATGPIAYESGGAGTWDSQRRRMIAMRHISVGTDGLTVGWSPTTADWDTLAPAGSGPNNAVAMLYDPLGDRMLVYGNSPAANWWFLSFAPTSDVPLEPAPPVRPLLTARPNPMIDRSVVRFELPGRGMARLSVIDARGRLITQLMSGELAAGRHETSWDGRAGDGERVASGIYFLRLEASGTVAATRLVVAD